MSETTDKLENARIQAFAQYESVAEMVKNYQAADDDDVYASIAPRLMRENSLHVVKQDDGYHWAKNFAIDDATYETEEECYLAACDDNGLRPDANEARRAIEEDALSVQVRSGWYNPGATPEPEEFEILLCTGGPAVRIIGELNEHNEPDRARLQCQDWFTSWTDVIDGVGNATLLAYAQCFWFGE